MGVSCVSADTVCSIRMLYDMAAKDRQAKAELMDAGRIFSKDTRSRRPVVICYIWARELFTEVLAGCQAKPILQ